MSAFYSPEELRALGFAAVGSDVFISRKCSIYGAEAMMFGDHVRIDDFCILSGRIRLGHYVHISAWCGLYGRFGIEIGCFCGVSPRSTLFSATDDFSGEAMISPMVPSHLVKLTTGAVVMKDYAQVGASSVVMPGVAFEEGAVCGAFSFVNRSLEAWTVNAGIPCRQLKARSERAKELSSCIGLKRKNSMNNEWFMRGGVRRARAARLAAACDREAA